MIKMYQYNNGRPVINIVLSHNEKTSSNLEGLLDSGAGLTTISKKHLISLGVDLDNPTGYVETTDSTGKQSKTPTYNINLNLDNGFLIKENYQVACSVADYQHVDLLIGTDILNETVLILNGIKQTYIISI